MSITAKQLADKLGLSEATVSLALNQRPGVSTETRKQIIDTALENGFDFSRLIEKHRIHGIICFIYYHRTRNQRIYEPIYEQIINGARTAAALHGFIIQVVNYVESEESMEDLSQKLKAFSCDCIILFATMISSDSCKKILSLQYPAVIVDTYFESIASNYVTINNSYGTYHAASYLLNKYQSQPGFINAGIARYNFSGRFEGYQHALAENGLTYTNSIIHTISPFSNTQGISTDMLRIIDNGAYLARSYVAENDFLALGAVNALRSRKIRVPEDIAIIGFDDIIAETSSRLELSTVHVPFSKLGSAAVITAKNITEDPSLKYLKIEVCPELIIRHSC